LENVVDSPKGTEYIIRFVSCLPKGLFKTGSGNKLGNVVPEMHLPGYKYIDNLNRLMQLLYFIHAEEKAGKNNFRNEKMCYKFFYRTIGERCQ